MTDALEQVIAETQSRFQKDPATAATTFASQSRLQQGLCSKAAMRQHELLVDEPEALGGADQGPNPVELILAALGTCQEITCRAYATAMGVALDGVSVTLEGDNDLQGFFGVNDAVRPGYQRIRGTVVLDSPASEADLQRLREAVNARCPVLDILSKSGSVELDLQVEPPPEIAAL
ncbi:MAG: OsmC family protein [Alphaproteobacteria bacterium]